MKYYEFEFTFTQKDETECTQEIVCDILSAQLAEIGFEAFENTEHGLKGYIQLQLLDSEALQETLSCFPFPEWQIASEQREAEYANWNEQWEREGFQPIIIDEHLCVHDSHHHDVPVTRYELIVSPRQAFGSGTHATTRQLLEVLLEEELTGQHVIDAGCGTGILGMLCLLKGAAQVAGYDIDEWSVENTRENVQLNGLSMDVWQGDASVLGTITAHHGQADLLIANINRNILLADMPAFSEALKPETGRLLLSGFYVEDIPYLVEKATSLGFREIKRRERDGWVVLMFAKN